MFCQDDGVASLLEGLAITSQDGVTSLLGFHAEPAGVCNDPHAGGQAHKIVGVGQWVGLVEIIDTPAEAAFRISPSSKDIHMQIADGQKTPSNTQIAKKRRTNPSVPYTVRYKGPAKVEPSGKRFPAETRTDFPSFVHA